MTYAIEPKSRADEDKLAPPFTSSWKRDLLIKFFRDRRQRIPHRRRRPPHIEAIVTASKSVPR